MSISLSEGNCGGNPLIRRRNSRQVLCCSLQALNKPMASPNWSTPDLLSALIRVTLQRKFSVPSNLLLVGIERDTVLAVAGIVSAFNGSVTLYRSWRDKRRERLENAQNQNLERSLTIGGTTPSRLSQAPAMLPAE
jgi:hypothetical protein